MFLCSSACTFIAMLPSKSPPLGDVAVDAVELLFAGVELLLHDQPSNTADNKMRNRDPVKNGLLGRYILAFSFTKAIGPSPLSPIPLRAERCNPSEPYYTI